MSQTKVQSIKETLCNTGVGLIGSWLITVTCIKHIAEPYTAATAAAILCTIWSIVRGYYIRRCFNRTTG